MAYQVTISKFVQKQLDKLPADVQIRLAAKIRLLATTPRPSGVVKIKGFKNEYRVRSGDYRVRYECDDDKAMIQILRCDHRKDVYKDKG